MRPMTLIHVLTKVGQLYMSKKSSEMTVHSSYLRVYPDLFCAGCMVFKEADSLHEWKMIIMWICVTLRKEEACTAQCSWRNECWIISCRTICWLNILSPPPRVYFHRSHAVAWHQQFADTYEPLFRVQKVTEQKIQLWCQVIRVLPANVCLCAQAAISERPSDSENHQSSDCAPPRATRLLWLPYNGEKCHMITWAENIWR